MFEPNTTRKYFTSLKKFVKSVEGKVNVINSGFDRSRRRLFTEECNSRGVEGCSGCTRNCPVKITVVGERSIS